MPTAANNHVRRGSEDARITALTCEATNDDHAAWPDAPANDGIVEGTCLPGYYVEEGKPYRACDLTGTFTAIVNPCLRTRMMLLR